MCVLERLQPYITLEYTLGYEGCSHFWRLQPYMYNREVPGAAPEARLLPRFLASMCKACD